METEWISEEEMAVWDALESSCVTSTSNPSTNVVNFGGKDHASSSEATTTTTTTTSNNSATKQQNETENPKQGRQNGEGESFTPTSWSPPNSSSFSNAASLSSNSTISQSTSPNRPETNAGGATGVVVAAAPSSNGNNIANNNAPQPRYEAETTTTTNINNNNKPSNSSTQNSTTSQASNNSGDGPPMCKHGKKCIVRKEGDKQFYVCALFFEPCEFSQFKALVPTTTTTTTANTAKPVTNPPPSAAIAPPPATITTSVPSDPKEVTASFEAVSPTQFSVILRPYSHTITSFLRETPMSSFEKGEWIIPVVHYAHVINGLRSIKGIVIKLREIPSVGVDTLQKMIKRPLVDTAAMLQRVPKEMLNALMPFQREGVEFALQRDGRVLIGDEMGLGKTLQAICIACMYRTLWPVLVIVPPSLRLTWAQEITRWIPRDEAQRRVFVNVVMSGSDSVVDGDFVVISYDLAQRKADDLSHRKFKVVVADESHYLKNFGAKRTKAIVPIIKASTVAVLLSGTPALNRPCELFQQVNALAPNVFRKWDEFVMRYCNGRQGPFGLDASGSSNARELHSLLNSTVMIRRLKKDVLSQLPPKRRQQVFIKISPSAEKKLREKLNSLPPLSDEGREPSPLISQLYKDTSEAKIQGVKEYISDLCEGDLKFLVFAHHTLMLDALQEAVVKSKRRFIRIDGSTPQASRAELVDRFQEDPNVQVAILSITAAGVGLTLTAASLVIFAELHWTPFVLLQAEDRAHRIGQVESVNVVYLHAVNSLDDIMWRLLCRKDSVVGSTLDGQQSHFTIDGSSKRAPAAAGDGNNNTLQSDGQGNISLGGGAKRQKAF